MDGMPARAGMSAEEVAAVQARRVLAARVVEIASTLLHGWSRDRNAWICGTIF